MAISENLLKEIAKELQEERKESDINQFRLFDLSKKPISTKKINWRVFVIDSNLNQVKAVNVFDLNWEVNGRIYEATKTIHNFKEWEKAIYIALRDFWSRFQYEIEITDLFDGNSVSETIDVWTQLTMNWDHFTNYLWNNKAIILEELEESYNSFSEYRKQRQEAWKAYIKQKREKK